MDLLFEAALFVGPRARRFDQFLEQVAVVDHGHAQVLGAGVTAGVAHRHLVGDAVVGDQLGVVDRQVRRALLEVGDRIAASLHHRADQRICVRDRGARIVNEVGLHAPPTGGVAVGFLGLQRPHLEALDALLAGLQFGLGLAPVAQFVDRGDVFGSVVGAHLMRAPALRVNDRAEHGGDRDQRENYGECSVHIVSSASRLQRGDGSPNEAGTAWFPPQAKVRET